MLCLKLLPLPLVLSGQADPSCHLTDGNAEDPGRGRSPSDSRVRAFPLFTIVTSAVHPACSHTDVHGWLPSRADQGRCVTLQGEEAA